MHINRGARVSAIGQVDVSAAPEAVWDVLADLARWPTLALIFAALIIVDYVASYDRVVRLVTGS